MFIFRIHKREDSSIESFKMAVNCARSSIESVLFDFNAVVEINENMILITAPEITAIECKEKIAGCFCQLDGNLFPEFSLVEHIQ